MPFPYRLRRASAAEWTSTNPVLADREAGAELDTGKAKIGDGTRAWTNLHYASVHTLDDLAADARDVDPAQGSLLAGELTAARLGILGGIEGRVAPLVGVDAIVAAQNVFFSHSNIEPTETTYTTSDGTPYKIVWVPDGTVVTAKAATFDDITDTYTIPATTGVEYLVDGVVTAAGTYGVTPPLTVTVDARPLEGYALKGTNQWIGEFTVDTTAPTAGTLAVTTEDTRAYLSVTGAGDNEVLHATPYSYSKDSGATWTAWQEASTYTFNRLASSTSYTFQHRVRDATGNISVGTAVTKSTTAAVIEVTEDFNVAAGTSYAGKTTTTGGLAWVDAQGGAIYHDTGAVTVDGTRATGGGARIDPTVEFAVAAIDFAVDSPYVNERVGLWVCGPAGTGTPPFFVQIRGSGGATGSTVNVFENSSGAFVETVTSLTGSSGRLSIVSDGANINVQIDGVTVQGPFPVPATTGKSVGFGLKHDAASTAPASADNFAVDYA